MVRSIECCSRCGVGPFRGGARKKSLKAVVVVHDLHRHGAQLGSLALCRSFATLGVEVVAVALGSGALHKEFADHHEIHVVSHDEGSEDELAELLACLRKRGFDVAFANSLVSGRIGPQLSHAGFQTALLVHEMKGVIEEYGLAEIAQSARRWASFGVFASEEVRGAFTSFEDATSPLPSLVLPQGMYHGALLIESPPNHSDSEDSPLVISVGYGDFRKGFDTFVELAEAARTRQPNLRFAWVGAIDEYDPRLANARDLASSLPNIELVGFAEDVGSWYAQATLLVITSREDPFPSVVLEAGVAGLGVLVLSGRTGVESAVRLLNGYVAESSEPQGVLEEVILALDTEAQAGWDLRERRADAVRWSFSHLHYSQVLLERAGLRSSIGVAIPSYAHEPYVEARLDSVIEQHRVPTQVVFLDDASPDNSLAIARARLRKYRGAWRAERNETNVGNTFLQWRAAASALTTKYVWIAESDDLAKPEFLLRLVDEMEKSDAGVGFCQSQPIDRGGVATAADYKFYLERHFPSLAWDERWRLDGSAFVARGGAVGNPMMTVSSMVFDRLALLEVLDWFAPMAMQFPTCGDWLIYMEILRRGRALCYVPEVLVGHRRHETSVIASARRETHLTELARAQALIAERWHLDESWQAKQKAHVCSLRA